MQVYELMLALEPAPDLDQVDRLYGYFDANGTAPEGVRDFTLVKQFKTPLASCTVEATSFEAALEMVLPKLHEEGLRACARAVMPKP